VTGKLSSFAPHATIVHADVDPAEISKNRLADVPIVGDAKEVLAELVIAVQEEYDAGRTPDYAAWWEQLNSWRDTYPLGYTEAEDGSLAPQFVISRLGTLVGPEAIYVAGVGQHQMWAAQFIKYEHPDTWLNSGGLGTMGYAVPAAMGAKVGRPKQRVVAIDGDGCFQMTAQELATSNTEDIPFVTAILNNGYLGMVRQWQELFFDERYSGVYLNPDVPDYVKLAEAYGAVGLRVDSPDDVDTTIEKAYSITDRSVVIDFRVDPREMVFPMVPSGASNDDIIVGPGDVSPTTDPGEAPIA
jgi:acetolactate synthase I/II/III large subunit